MKKKFLLLLMAVITTQVFAGQFDNAMKYNDKVFLYLYSNDCRYCVLFNTNYKKLESTFSKNAKFLKINANTAEGMDLISSIGVDYLPYVLMIDNNKHVIRDIAPECLLNYACVSKVTNRFLNK